MSPRQDAAFRRSCYRAGPVCARPGRRSASADAWLAATGARQGAFVTAWNPRGRRRPKGWNRRLQRSLRAACRRLPCAEGMSGLGRWWEHNLLLAGDLRRLAAIAWRFGQAAILAVRRGQPARLVYAPSLLS